jgi:hypothetical protein
LPHFAKNKREESMLRRTSLIAFVSLVSAAVMATPASAQKKYDPGASDTEIKIGNIMPYSGPASAYGTIGKAQAAYFNKINAEGGINGRKINFITYDDAYSPPEGRRAGTQAGRERRGVTGVPAARHAVELGNPEVHEHEESPAALRGDRRDQMGRSAELSMDHGVAAQLSE